MELKIIFNLLCFAAVVKSFALIDLALKKKFVSNILQSQGLNDDNLSEETHSYRLPNVSIPLRYDLWLKTDIDKGIFDFSGRVKILIRAVDSTQQITLLARGLIIDNIDLLNVDNTLSQANLEYDYYEVVEFLIISLPSLLTDNDEIILDISYHGELNSAITGFYRSSYRNDDGEDIRFAATNFQPTDARHAMPCYDEPGIRAVYGLEIQHDQSLNAISNMPVSTRDLVQGTNYVTSKFPDTVVMQSYQLGFFISDYTYISNNDVNVEQRIYGAPQRIERGDGAFALGVVGLVLKQLEDHFQVKYPLPKIDHITVDAIWGSVNNFGLMFYQESRIMEGEAITLISQQFARQYFGNIVGVQWWTYTWLNEGFATLYEYFIPSLIYPEFGFMDEFEMHVLRNALAFDIGPNARPLNFYVESPREIAGMFDVISCFKGAAVLRMFQEALTISTFSKGLNYYLTEMNFMSATPEDLHRNLQRAFDEDFSNSIDLSEAMKSWEEKAGYPIIRVEKDETGMFRLTQERFGDGNETYMIPISFTLKSEVDFDDKSPKLWLSESSANLEVDDDWIILNIQNTGYYKVSYDIDIWIAIITDLLNDHEMFPPVHRRQFFRDTRESLFEETIEAFRGLEHLSSLSEETHLSVWNEADDILFTFLENLFGTSAWSNFHVFIQIIVQPHINRLGFEEVEGEPTEDADFRSLVRTLSCKGYHVACLTRESQRLVSFIETGEGNFNLCEGLRLANPAVHEILINDLLTNSMLGNYRDDYIFNLGCPFNQALIMNYLQLVLDESNNLSMWERTALIENTLGKSVVALEAVMEFIFVNYAEIGPLM